MILGFILKYWHWGALGVAVGGLVWLVWSRDAALEDIGRLEEQLKAAEQWQTTAAELEQVLKDVTVRLDVTEKRLDETKNVFDQAWRQADQRSGRTAETIIRMVEAPAAEPDVAVAVAAAKLKETQGVEYVEVPAPTAVDSVRDDLDPAP